MASLRLIRDRSGSLWNPGDVLYNLNSSEPRCIGCATSQGRRRCRNRIASHNFAEANRLLIELSEREPKWAWMVESLEKVASLLLCKAAHQNQANETVEKWRRAILDIEKSTHATEGPQRTASPNSSRLNHSGIAVSAVQRSSRAPSIAGESRTAHLTWHTSDQGNRRGHPARPTPPPPVNFAVVRSPSSTRSAADIATRPSATGNDDSGTFDPSTTAARASGGCKVTHATRRAFQDERDEEGNRGVCGICRDCDEPMQRSKLGDLVWCKAQ